MKKKPSGIGGQALMEGVMMKNGGHYACAVRKPDGTIEVDDQRTTSLGDKYKFFKLPIIRGVVIFVESLKIGIKTLTWSASFFEDEEAGDDKGAKKSENASALESTAENGSDVNGNIASIDDVSDPNSAFAEGNSNSSCLDGYNSDSNINGTDIDGHNADYADANTNGLDGNIDQNGINTESSELNGLDESSIEIDNTGSTGKKPAFDGTDESLRSVKVTKSVAKEKSASEKTKESLLMGLLIVLAVVFAVGLFMILPYFISTFLKKVITSTFLLALIEGLIRVSLFIGYVALISCMKDIKRVFMYHGAEHKSINCVESGKELTVENVRTCSKEHKRCGTSFLLIVMVMSIIFFLFIRFDSTILMIVARLLLIPVIAGLSYEFLRLAGNSDNKVIAILSKPGLALQKLTTREPDDSMIECAIASVEAVFDWRAYQADVRRMEEEELEAKNKSRENRRKEREAEIRKRMEAKGIVEEDMSDDKIKEIDAAADRLAEKEIEDEKKKLKLKNEAAKKAKAFEKELEEEEKRQDELSRKRTEEYESRLKNSVPDDDEEDDEILKAVNNHKKRK